MSYARVELIQTCHHCVHIDLQSTIVVAVNIYCYYLQYRWKVVLLSFFFLLHYRQIQILIV